VIQSGPAALLSNFPMAEPFAISKSTRPSKWLWIPYIWLFFTSTRSLSSWIAGGGSSIADAGGSPYDRFLMTLLMVVGLFVLASRGQQATLLLARNKWAVALFALILLSIVWSNFPDVSVRRSIRSVGTFIMVLMVLTESVPEETVRVLLKRLYFVHIPASIIAIKYFRHFAVGYNWDGSEEQWKGLATDKNSLGHVAMCSGLFCLWQIMQDWPKKDGKRQYRKLLPSFVLFLLSLYLLRGSKNVHSSTAILGFVLCVAFLMCLQFAKARAAQVKKLVLVGMAAVIVFGPIGYGIFQSFDAAPVKAVFQATGRDMTFTDRNLIWTDVINDVAKTPILGVGFGAFWVGPIGYTTYPMPNWSRKTPGWRPEEGHNGFVDIYAQLGVVGLIVFLFFTVSSLSGALTNLGTNFSYGSLRLTFLLAIILSNITETSFLDGTHGLWFLFLLFCVNFPKPLEPLPAPAFQVRRTSRLAEVNT
jgi:exopolysaccharide production protein ExoQ